MNNRFNRPERPPQVEQKTLKVTDAQEHLVRRLGQALVLQWDSFPDELQDRLMDQAAVVDDRGAATPEEIEAFIRDAKVVALSKAAAGK